MTKDQWLSTTLDAVAMTALLAGWIVSLTAPDAHWSAAAAASCYVLAGAVLALKLVCGFRSRRNRKRK